MPGVGVGNAEDAGKMECNATLDGSGNCACIFRSTLISRIVSLAKTCTAGVEHVEFRLHCNETTP